MNQSQKSIIAQYNYAVRDGMERHGWYHSLSHVETLQSLYRKHLSPKEMLALPYPVFDLAARWHDFVYVPGKLGNESKSAEAMLKATIELNNILDIEFYPIEVIHAAHRLIESTGNPLECTRIDEIAFNALDWFCYFGAAGDQYLLNRDRLKNEYVRGGGVNPQDFYAGRVKFLQQAMDRDLITIFHPMDLIPELNRLNITDEIAHWQEIGGL